MHFETGDRRPAMFSVLVNSNPSPQSDQRRLRMNPRAVLIDSGQRMNEQWLTNNFVTNSNQTTNDTSTLQDPLRHLVPYIRECLNEENEINRCSFRNDDCS